MGQKRIPDAFSAILRERGRSLQSEGVRDVALPPDAAMQAITILKVARVGILGGEVWVEKGTRFELCAADVWDIERSDFEDEDQFLAASWQMAEKQVARLAASSGVL